MRKPIYIDLLIAKGAANRYTTRRLYRKQQRNLIDSICECAASWFALETEQQWPDNQIEARILLKQYVMESLKPTTRGSSFFIPTSVWMWIAGQVVTYVVKVLIELYWSDIESARSEKG